MEFFPHIEPLILGPAARVMSLRDGTKKMSKSDPSDQSRINLNDDPDTIALKIRRAKTDPEPLPSEPAGLEKRPEARNLVGIYAAVSGESQEALLARFAGSGFGPFKAALADALVAHVEPIGERTRDYLADKAELDQNYAGWCPPCCRHRRADYRGSGADRRVFAPARRKPLMVWAWSGKPSPGIYSPTPHRPACPMRSWPKPCAPGWMR